MKKIIMCGATHGSNFGDSLFALMFVEYVEKKYPDLEILFTNVSEHSSNKLGLKQATKSDLKNSDGLVYISGGYFGQSHNESFRGSIFRWLNYYSVGLQSIRRNIPIAIIGVGAGPLDRSFLRKTAVKLFNMAKVVSVRDKQSFNYMKDYGVTNEIIVTSDSAQEIDLLNSLMKNTSFSNDLKLPDDKQLVFIHVTDAQGEEEYYKKIVRAISDKFGSTDNYHFIIGSDAVIDQKYLQKNTEVFPSSSSTIFYYDNPIEFLKLLNKVDIIVTPKLHVGILGATFGKSVLSFPIHPGKTLRYYGQIGYPEHSLSLFDVNDNEVEYMLENYFDKMIPLTQEIKSQSQKNYELLGDFISKYVY